MSQLEEALEGTDVQIYYPHDVLLKEKANNYVYYKADTHWNELGAFYGYQVLMDAVKKDFPDLKTLSLDDYEIYYSTMSNDPIELMLNYTIEDTNYPHLNKINPYQFQILQDDLKGAGVITTNPNADLDVIMLRDSFTIALTPYISETFGNVEYYWYKTVNETQDYIAERKPDIVIEEVVERGISRAYGNNQLKGVE